LPYRLYNAQEDEKTGSVSAWKKAQLGRSHEFEVAEEWEAERVTWGRAELLTAIAQKTRVLGRYGTCMNRLYPTLVEIHRVKKHASQLNHLSSPATPRRLPFSHSAA
jgi:hypothetical protein